MKPRLNSNSRFGSLAIFGKRIFFKILPSVNYRRELEGYFAIRGYYPVPNLIFRLQLFGVGILVFEYESTIDAIGGHLVDFFCGLSDDYFAVLKVFHLYKDVFQKTITAATGEACDVFFRNRVRDRALKWYTNELMSELSPLAITLNGRLLTGSLEEFLCEIKKFYAEERSYPCVISQCDPNDLNIGTKPVIFDYQAGGYVPLMAEYASFIWFYVGMGNYLAPKHNARTYVGKPSIRECLDIVSIESDGASAIIKHAISERRRWAIVQYTKLVIKPLVDASYPHWWDDFIFHLCVRILTVFDLTSKSDRGDLMFCLAYLLAFRELRAETPSDFVENLISLYD